MNKLIEEIMLEATSDMPNVYYVPGMYFERFAERLIQECNNVDLYWLSENDRKSVIEKIGQHFGAKVNLPETTRHANVSR